MPHGGNNQIPIMTETEEPGQFFEPEAPVRVKMVEEYRQECADKASYMTFAALTSGSPGPIQILPRAPNRHRAIINVTGGSSAVCILNKALASLTVANPVGWTMGNNAPIVLENIEALYAVWQAGSPVISVIEERWLTEGEHD